MTTILQRLEALEQAAVSDVERGARAVVGTVSRVQSAIPPELAQVVVSLLAQDFHTYGYVTQQRIEGALKAARAIYAGLEAIAAAEAKGKPLGQAPQPPAPPVPPRAPAAPVPAVPQVGTPSVGSLPPFRTGGQQ